MVLRRLGMTILLAAHALVFMACASGTATTTTSDITAPVVIERVNPVIPSELRSVRGVVEVVGTIPKEGGKMRDIRVVHTEDSRLNQFVLDALSKWTWKPGAISGEPVDSEFKVRIKFPPG